LQNNPDNIYFKQVEKLFAGSVVPNNLLLRLVTLIPEIGTVIFRIFSINNKARTFINTRLLPLISSTKQLDESPFMWLSNRLHTIVEQRQQTPDSRADLLQLMLRVATKEKIDVSKIFEI
jgi:hypothetical protein